jgi:GNAT superfamily N-acetyltransferase
MITQANLTDLSLDLRKKYPNIIQNLCLIVHKCPATNVQYIELVFIKIKKSQRGKGYGSIVLSSIVQFADEFNVQIRLTPAAMYGTDIQALYGFYLKSGFSHCTDGITMIYYPKK